MNAPNSVLKSIFMLDASHLPDHPDMEIACLDIDSEFPLHCATGIVRVPDDGNIFSEWLKTQGFQFTNGRGWLAVYGT